MAEVSESKSKTPTDYFNALSQSYATSTGNTTATALGHAISLQHISPRLSTATAVHDNACGVGTATQVLLPHLSGPPPRVEGTDNNASMISAFEDTIIKAGWNTVRAQVMDSLDLKFPDGNFDLSVTNVSLTNFSEPKKAIAEVHRTLESEGMALFVQWKRFTVADMVHAAQREIKGAETKLMIVPGREWMQEGVIKDAVTEAGFSEVKQDVVRFPVQGLDLEGIRGFMLGSLTRQAREGWTPEDEEKWEGAVDQAIKEEVSRAGDVLVEFWVVTAIKA